MQIKETNANINKIKADNISQISKIGSAINFDSMTLMININGIANKKIIPKAINFLDFPMRLKTAATIHRKTIEAIAIAAPIENISFTFIKLLNKNKCCLTKINME